MQRLMTIGLMAALSGCAVTPAELRQTGTRSDYTSTRTPARFAACISENAENQNFQARTRVIESSGITETMIFAIKDGGINAVIISEASPSGSGTLAKIIRGDQIPRPESFQATILQGC